MIDTTYSHMGWTNMVVLLGCLAVCALWLWLIFRDGSNGNEDE